VDNKTARADGFAVHPVRVVGCPTLGVGRMSYSVYMAGRKYGYALEKLGVAVQRLVGVGDIRERLYEAFKSLITLQPRDLPEHIRDEFSALRRDMTWVPVDQVGEGQLKSTLRAMTDEEADRLAKEIYVLYEQVITAYYEEE
jgi:hypothetical protein